MFMSNRLTCSFGYVAYDRAEVVAVSTRHRYRVLLTRGQTGKGRRTFKVTQSSVQLSFCDVKFTAPSDRDGQCCDVKAHNLAGSRSDCIFEIRE